jgi:hypothetical protein
MSPPMPSSSTSLIKTTNAPKRHPKASGVVQARLVRVASLHRHLHHLRSTLSPTSQMVWQEWFASRLFADSLLEVLNKYRSHVADDSEQMIDLAYKNLIQKLDKTTLGPDALNTRIADAIKAAEHAFKPFANTIVSVVYKDETGTITSEADVPIGNTFRRFDQKLQKTKDDLEKLWKEWDAVRREIAETGAQILHDPKFPSQFGLEAVNSRSSPSSRTNPEVENLRKLIKRESEKSHKELDQEVKDAINKHKEYQKMWHSWLQDELN